MLGETILEESGLKVGYIILLVAGVGFICSLTYNHGYFWYLDAGIRILSIGDILTSYSLWVPGLGTLLFGAGLDLLLQHIEHEEASKLKRHKKLIKNILGVPHIILLIISTFVITTFILDVYYFRPLLVWLCVAYLWISIGSMLFSTRPFKSHISKLVLGFFIFIPVILSLLFILGLDKFKMDEKLSTANAKIFFVSSKEVAHPIILIRHLERGVLTKNTNSNNLKLFLWDDISSVEILS